MNILNIVTQSCVEKRTISMLFIFASTTTMVHILPTVPSGDRATGQPGELQSVTWEPMALSYGVTPGTDYHAIHG